MSQMREEIKQLRSVNTALLEALATAARRLDDAADLMADGEDAYATHEMAEEARAVIQAAKGEQL